MPQVEFEPTIPVFERAKIVHALDLAAIDRQQLIYTNPKFILTRSRGTKTQ
jgi:hypothetical protein